MEYTVKVGALTASTSETTSTATLISARVERGMDTNLGTALVRLHPFDQSMPAAGDPLTVEIDGGDGAAVVFTGEISLARVTAAGLEVQAVDGLGKVARAEVEGSYEEQTVGAILKELLTKAGAEAGEVEDGPTLPRMVLHRSVRALQHARGLAALGGFDLWTDGEGKAQLAAPADGAADHTVTWGETLLGLELAAALATPDGWEVWGEGAAGTKGKDKAHWLAADLSGVTGKASVSVSDGALSVEAGAAGKQPTRWSLGVVRSAELAETIARNQATARAGRPVHGTIDLLGTPDIEPGQRVSLAGLPEGHAASDLTKQPLRVRGVRHTVDANGYLTRLVL